MNLNNYVQNHGKMNIKILVLTDLKRKIKGDFEFVMKTKTHRLNAPKRKTV